MFKYILAGGLLLSSVTLTAAPISCDGKLSDVTITSAINTSTNDDIVPTGENIEASACAGFFTGNDNSVFVNNNTGTWGDGVLNGGVNNRGATWFNAPGAFITSDDLQDLDGNGLVNDPGWIYLGKDEGAGFLITDKTQWYGNGNDSAFNLSEFLSINFSCADECKVGTWSLTFPKPGQLMSELSSTVFGDSFFDHLALSFKVGKNTIIYDFNFNAINDETGGVFDLNTPHNFEGEYDLSAFQNDISHISVWARDPLNITSVDEPVSLFLFSSGFLALVLMRIKRK